MSTSMPVEREPRHRPRCEFLPRLRCRFQAQESPRYPRKSPVFVAGRFAEVRELQSPAHDRCYARKYWPRRLRSSTRRAAWSTSPGCDARSKNLDGCLLGLLNGLIPAPHFRRRPPQVHGARQVAAVVAQYNTQVQDDQLLLLQALLGRLARAAGPNAVRRPQWSQTRARRRPFAACDSRFRPPGPVRSRRGE